MKKKKLIIGLDLSSERIRAAAGFWDKDELKVKITGTSQSKASGLRDGLVVDMVTASDCLAAVIKELRKESPAGLGWGYAGISGTQFNTSKSDAKITISSHRSRQITSADLAELNKVFSKSPLPLEKCLVQHIVHDYSVDNQQGVQNPLGMSGTNLVSHNYLVTGPYSAVINLKKCLANAGLRLGGFVMAGIAAGYPLIDKTGDKSDCLLINIRNMTTDVVLYSAGRLCSFEIFGYGDRQLTEKVALLFKVPWDEAGNIKQKYGCVQTELVRSKERVIISGENGVSKSIARQALAEVMEPAVKELFFKIKETIERNHHEYSLIKTIIVTGEGCLADGMIEVAEDVFERPAKLGLVKDIIAPAQILNSPEWSTALGLISHGLGQKEIPEHTKPGLAPWINRFKKWIEEYF